MVAPQERSKGYELNPRVISPEAVQAVMADLQGERPSTYFQTLHEKRIEGTDFSEIVHPEFQVFRIGALGFGLPVAPEDRDRYGISVETLSSLGREDESVPEDQDIGCDSLESINTMRAFVASTFFEESARQKLPAPEINDKLIDPPPVKRVRIERAVASKPGMFLYEWEEFEARWAGENPDLYQAMIQLRDELADYYAKRMVAAYQGLPQDYMDRIAPDVESKYRDYLLEYALRTYAMLAPRPPRLIEVRNVRPR